MIFNGNRVVKLSMPGLKSGFSIQMNGTLPNTNTIMRGIKTVNDLKPADLKQIEDEVVDYIQKYGSALQKKGLRTYKKESVSKITESSESYYARELANIKTDGEYPATFKFTNDGGSTKVISLNPVSAKVLINWLKKAKFAPTNTGL